MRIFIAPIAAAIVGLAFSAPAEAGKKKYRPAHKHTKVVPSHRAPRDTGWTSFDPADHKIGTTGWWRAMDREHRGGFRS